LHIYAFGSVCRGEVDIDSDIDLLAIVDRDDSRFNPDIYSIYSYKRIAELWAEGNAFAWHLATESRMIYASDKTNYIEKLGLPSEYRRWGEDCLKFFNLYCKAIDSIQTGGNSIVFEMSTIFLALRNFATCFLLGKSKVRNFSRRSALQMGEKSLNLSENVYELLERSRILSIRGTGKMIQRKEVESSIYEIKSIKTWMEGLLREV
jgi:hypothetical protein